MTSTFFADTNPKIRKLKKDGKYSVANKSGLTLVKRGESKYFVGNIRFPFNRTGQKISYPVGVFEKEINVDQAIDKWNEIKLWSKKNNKNPKLFGQEEEQISEKTFREIAEEYMETVYKKKVKETVYADRTNKLNQMLKYIGDDYLISDLEIGKGGRQYISKMLKTIFHESPVQLTRCRQLLNWIFNYAEDETFIGANQNPVLKKFQWETGNQKNISKKTFANTITKNSWGLLPEFLKSVSKNSCGGNKLTALATKTHLLMCIRTGVINRLEWSWYSEEDDTWIIPSQTHGLKRKKFDDENHHLIPSTPEINRLMKQIREISGWQKYCFYSLGGKNFDHIGEETINDHLKNLGWKDKQSAHQWRSVITTSAIERSDFGYEIIDRQLGRMGHLNGTRGHYDRSTLLEKRTKLMKWWSKSLIQEGLIV